MTMWRSEMAQINKIIDAKGVITTNTNGIHRMIKEYFENSYLSKLENLEKMDKFLYVYN
jgi:hypothetical protein